MAHRPATSLPNAHWTDAPPPLHPSHEVYLRPPASRSQTPFGWCRPRLHDTGSLRVEFRPDRYPAPVNHFRALGQGAATVSRESGARQPSGKPIICTCMETPGGRRASQGAITACPRGRREGEPMRLANRAALITGGNSGIGLATARLFRAEGGRVAIVGRSKETLDAAAEISAGMSSPSGPTSPMSKRPSVRVCTL